MSRRFHLDTSAFSRMMRRDPGVLANVRRLEEGDVLAVSAIARGEVRYGLERLPQGRRRQALETRADEIFAALEIDAVTAAAADAYGRLKRESEDRGRPRSENDLWIAAAALAAGCTLVTGDGDFESIEGLAVERWSAG